MIVYKIKSSRKVTLSVHSMLYAIVHSVISMRVGVVQVCETNGEIVNIQNKNVFNTIDNNNNSVITYI